ncbi:serine/threonine-protein phosphatase-like protein [Trifolium pratense]|uniref:Serine/threonine-protein phosphatase-like protein n=1 Tax=Trifolium pratense TaxID=57577 RepID=A0A2K3MNM1_TRIPR|nr:serine/threonine-protein phosphatase-like protein [Trifolium pratense]
MKVRLQCHFDAPNPATIPLLEECGFGYVVRLRNCTIDWHLITTIVMRWRPEMHTFHLPVGECTITLQDVNMLLDLQISGQAVTGRNVSVWEEFPRLFGVAPPDTTHGYSIRTSWLQQQLRATPPNPTQ